MGPAYEFKLGHGNQPSVYRGFIRAQFADEPTDDHVRELPGARECGWLRKDLLEPACSTLRLRDFVVRMGTAGKSRFPFSGELRDFLLDATVIVDRIAAKST